MITNIKYNNKLIYVIYTSDTILDNCLIFLPISVGSLLLLPFLVHIK